MQKLPGSAFADNLILAVFLLITAELIVGYIFMVTAIWRAMRAHESLAQFIKELVKNLKA